jgi:nucleolar MIF4G domain-containing protein 1
LLSILHSTVGEEVGGHVIHTLIRQFDETLKQTDQLSDSKKIDNLVLIIINLYVCGLIESVLVYDLMMKLCEIFNEKCIELINLILKSVGFILRKDNPIQMKELILKVQNLALSIDKNSLSGNRISFVLESLIAIKNNNKSKVKGYGTVVQVELIENTLKSTLKKVRVNGIGGRYDAVLQSSHWYSYTQNIEALSLDKTQSNDTKFDTINDEMNDRLFKALRLNTPLRKTIFTALSTCNDYVDAAHRLISISKKQFSEVINVLIHVAIHEKNYNPFYLHLFQHLSKCDRKYKVSFHLNLI